MTAKAEPQPVRRASAGAADALRVACLIASGFAAAAVVDGSGGHAFCAHGSGCDAVRSSEVGELVGPALPWLGSIGFSCILFASLAAQPLLRRAAWSFAFTGGIAGLVLLALQAFVIGAFCPLCLGADLAAIAAGVLGLVLLRSRYTPQPVAREVLVAWTAALGVAIATPWLWTVVRPEPPPAFVRALARPGVVTVVELSDFECPYCRALHPVLNEVLAVHGARVRLVRMSIPLPGHRHSREAARAYHCAGAQGRGEPMADVLFSSELESELLAVYARSIGLDVERYERCMADPAIEQRIDRDVATVQAAGFDGLPCVWVGKTRILGFGRSAGAAPYEKALQRELHGPEPARHLAGIAWLTGIALAVWPAVRRLGRSR